MSRGSIEISNITGSYTQDTPDITTYPSIYAGSSSSSYGSTTSKISSSFLPLQSEGVGGVCLYICKSNYCLEKKSQISTSVSHIRLYIYILSDTYDLRMLNKLLV